VTSHLFFGICFEHVPLCVRVCGRKN
jgi:hypothetical protein